MSEVEQPLKIICFHPSVFHPYSDTKPQHGLVTCPQPHSKLIKGKNRARLVVSGLSLTGCMNRDKSLHPSEPHFVYGGQCVNPETTLKSLVSGCEVPYEGPCLGLSQIAGRLWVRNPLGTSQVPSDVVPTDGNPHVCGLVTWPSPANARGQ